MTRHTLEQYFNLHQGKAIDFSLRAEHRDDRWLFYIHPQNVDGETWDFQVNGNQLTNIVPGETQDELLMKIDFLISKVNELESVGIRKTEELHRRVQELEQFQREYETAQEYERDRSE